MISIKSNLNWIWHVSHLLLLRTFTIRNLFPRFRKLDVGKNGYLQRQVMRFARMGQRVAFILMFYSSSHCKTIYLQLILEMLLLKCGPQKIINCLATKISKIAVIWCLPQQMNKMDPKINKMAPIRCRPPKINKIAPKIHHYCFGCL